MDAVDCLLFRGGVNVPARDYEFLCTSGEPLLVPLAFPELRIALSPFDSRIPLMHRVETKEHIRKLDRLDRLHSEGWAVVLRFVYALPRAFRARAQCNH